MTKSKTWKKKVTQERLRSLLSYDKETGTFTWLVNGKGPNIKIGNVAGCLLNGRYIVITIDGIDYLAHRLAWFYVNGKWPEDELDHRDGNKQNNCFENLREANRSQNGCNKGKPRNNSSGYKGVGYHKQNKKWRAYIQKNKRYYHLGMFDTPEEAHEAYKKATDSLHGEYGRTEGSEHGESRPT